MATSASIGKDTRHWLEWMLTTSVPLRRLDEEGMPVALASSCLVQYRNRHFLLTVEHAASMRSSGWVIHLGYRLKMGKVEVYHLRGFNYVGEIVRGSGTLRKVDFCYAEVPADLDALYQHITPHGIHDERPRHVFLTDLTAAPSADLIYAFAGEVKTERHGDDIFVSDMQVIPGMRYVGTEGEHYMFKLPIKHPGHEQFFGCSGAPIVDRNGTVVALVCDGDDATDTIRGISLSRYRFALDFICEGKHHQVLGRSGGEQPIEVTQRDP